MLRLLAENEMGIRRSVNPRLVVETLLLRWAMLDRIVDLQEVLEGGRRGSGEAGKRGQRGCGAAGQSEPHLKSARLESHTERSVQVPRPRRGAGGPASPPPRLPRCPAAPLP